MASPRSRATGIIAVSAGLVLLLAAPASAHVTVHSDDAARGATDAAVMFRVPNEESKAAVVRVQVFFPSDHPLLDVLVEPRPGWHFKAQTKRLRHPISTDDGPITSAVSEVTWTADHDSDGLQAGEADDFVVTAGQLPDTASVTFRALQTYSNGNVVKWIEVAAPGADEPEHPAPILTLAPEAGAGAAVPAADSSSSGGTATGLAIAALVVAVIAAGLAGTRLRHRS